MKFYRESSVPLYTYCILFMAIIGVACQQSSQKDDLASLLTSKMFLSFDAFFLCNCGFISTFSPLLYVFMSILGYLHLTLRTQVFNISVKRARASNEKSHSIYYLFKFSICYDFITIADTHCTGLFIYCPLNTHT